MSRLQTWYHALPKATRGLLTINVVVYVCWVLLLAHIPATRDFFWNHLAFHTEWPRFLMEPWQFITYNFLHLGDLENPGLSFGSLLHIGFNMLWFYWIGRDHEEMHGSKHIVALYLITGMGGGLISVLLFALLPPSVLGSHEAVIHGASASVLGLLTAVAVMYPHKKIGLILIGPVRLLYLVLAFLAFDLIFRFGGGVAVGAHLGGAFFGFLFVKIEDKGVDLTSWTRIFFREPRRRRSPAPAEENQSFLGRLEARLASRSQEDKRTPPRGESKKRTKAGGKSPMAKIRALHTTEKQPPPSLEHEIDRILDKISEQGMESLTVEEKRLLEEASRK